MLLDILIYCKIDKYCNILKVRAISLCRKFAFEPSLYLKNEVVLSSNLDNMASAFALYQFDETKAQDVACFH